MEFQLSLLDYLYYGKIHMLLRKYQTLKGLYLIKIHILMFKDIFLFLKLRENIVPLVPIKR